MLKNLDPITDEAWKRRDHAIHEAGHAVQAFLNGLGVADISIYPSRIGTLKQRELEEKGINLIRPDELTDEVKEFYRRDIEVRVAGPLATFRFRFSHHPDFATEDPSAIELWMYGGASTDEVEGDEVVALHEAAQLKRAAPVLMPEQYVEWVKSEVWTNSILDDQIWTMVLTLADELEKRGRMEGSEVHVLLSQSRFQSNTIDTGIEIDG